MNDDKALLIITPKDCDFTISDFGMNEAYRSFKSVPTIHKLKGYEEKFLYSRRYVDEPHMRRLVLVKIFDSYESLMFEYAKINDCFDTDLKVLAKAKVDDNTYKKGYILKIGKAYLGYDRYQNEDSIRKGNIAYRGVGDVFTTS